jgi:hypothetical protein
MTLLFFSWPEVLVSTGAANEIFGAGDAVDRLAQLIWGRTTTVVTSSKTAAATISLRFWVFMILFSKSV